MVKEFLYTIDSFNFTLLRSTHRQSHTLDLILSLGFPASNVVIDDICLSDHKPVILNITVSFIVSKHKQSSRHVVLSILPQLAIFQQLMALVFSSATSSLHLQALAQKSWFFQSSFSSICIETLDAVVPYKGCTLKPRVQPWLNEHSQALRQKWRKAERKWKKVRLQVSQEMLRV